jgi:hypothetical protein
MGPERNTAGRMSPLTCFESSSSVRRWALCCSLALALAGGARVHAQAAAETAPSPAPAEPAAPPVAERTEPGPAQRFVEARRVDRLEASIAELAYAEKLGRRWGGVASVVLGGALIVVGVLIAVEDEGGWGTRGRAAVSGGIWAAGAASIGSALYRWSCETPAERRLARWSEQRSDGKLDLFEFARFEGELASEAELAGQGRGLSAVGGFALIAGGAGMIALGASGEIGDDAATSAYIWGGVLAGLGVIQSVSLFLVDTPAERAWRHYSEGGGGLSSNLRLELRDRPLAF